MSSVVFIFGVTDLGNLISAARERLGMTQEMLRAGLNLKSTQTISNWENGRTAPNLSMMRPLANELKLPLEELMKLLPEETKSEAGITEIEGFVEPPTWEVEIAAGAWIQMPICQLDADDPEQNAIIKTGRFRLRILGGCMEPDYESGQTVEFKIIVIDRDPLEVGADYVVAKTDGTATFKRLYAKDEDSLTLFAINQKDFPGVLVVAQQEIGRIAKVVHRLLPPPEKKIPRIKKEGR